MIVLDTHTLVWWANGDDSQLSPAARKAIKAHTGEGEIAISSISAWEIAMLVERGRLALSMSVSQWLKLAVIGTLEGQDEVAFRDRLMSHVLFTSAAADGLLMAQADKEIRTRVQAAHGKRLREYRERFGLSRGGD